MAASQGPGGLAISLLTGVLVMIGITIRGWLFPSEHSPWSAGLIGGSCSLVARWLVRLGKGTTS